MHRYVLRSPDGAVTITDAAPVARIAAVLDGLRQLPDGICNCPAETAPEPVLTSMQLTFRTAPAVCGGRRSGVAGRASGRGPGS
jgi:hypothetical protein